jgi:AcrR family transcriptional regulator
LPPETKPAAGLRERKKAKTRAAIQHEALVLFREHGYEATTVEQIAEAAEIAVSTFFRYFPAKEDLVLTDDYDPLIIEAFREQPPGLGPVEAVRRALRAVFAGLSGDEMADMRERAVLALAVPELRAAMLDQFAQIIRQITDLVAGQTGRARDDFAVHTLAGAILGVMISAEFYWVEHPGSDLVTLLDDALAQLESGLPL